MIRLYVYRKRDRGGKRALQCRQTKYHKKLPTCWNNSTSKTPITKLLAMKWNDPRSPKVLYNIIQLIGCRSVLKNSRTDTYIFMEQGWVGSRRKNQAMCEELIRKWSWIWFFTQPKRFEHWLGSLSPSLSLSLFHGFDFTTVGLHHCAHNAFWLKETFKNSNYYCLWLKKKTVRL